jgi:DNA-binding IclR family transcriptional regulator
VAVAEPDKSLSISFQPGYIMPLHRGAVAKMLLATTPKRKQQSLIAKIRPALSPQESADLIIALEKIRKENFAESESEVDKGVWAVAAPIVVSNRVIASVSVAAPTFHVDENARQSIRAKVSQAALDIADAIASSEIDLT